MIPLDHPCSSPRLSIGFLLRLPLSIGVLSLVVCLSIGDGTLSDTSIWRPAGLEVKGGNVPSVGGGGGGGQGNAVNVPAAWLLFRGYISHEKHPNIQPAT